jgi:hypothetical protein
MTEQLHPPVYYILAAPGAGSFFLASIFAKYLKYPCATKISRLGHCHDLGQGEWRSTEYIQMANIHFNKIKDQEIVVVSHQLHKSFEKEKPNNLKIILINYELSDSYYIALLHSVKAFLAVWSEEHYNTIAGPDWPAYNSDVILTSDLVRNELLPYRIEEMNHWIESINLSVVDYFIDFKTVFGLNSDDLNQQVANILNLAPEVEIKSFITEYQTVNKTLYNLH